MSELATWPTAQLDERERIARRTQSSDRWRFDDTSGASPRLWVGPNLRDIWIRDVNEAMWMCDDEEDGCPEEARGWIAEGRHIAANDPVYVLADIASKRAILAEHGNDNGFCSACAWSTNNGYDWVPRGWPCRTVLLVIAPFRGRPGWDPAWEVTDANTDR